MLYLYDFIFDKFNVSIGKYFLLFRSVIELQRIKAYKYKLYGLINRSSI